MTKASKGIKKELGKKTRPHEVENALGYEEGSAAKAFETWNKNYGRKRINFQKLSRSEAGTRDIETAKKELEEFFFLHWPDSFIRPRKTKTNIPETSMEINESSNAGDELENNGYGSYESEDAGCNAITDATESIATLQKSSPSKKCKKKRAAVKQKSVSLKDSKSGRNHGAELEVIRDMLKILNKRLTSMKDEKQDDKDGLLGKLVVAELKSLQQRQKYRSKHERTISFLNLNYKTITMLMIMSEMQIEFKAQFFMMKLMGTFKMI